MNESGWISEMYGYSFGAPKPKLYHVISDKILIYPGYVPEPGVNYWVFHYGLEFSVGIWSFDKAKWRTIEMFISLRIDYMEMVEVIELHRSQKHQYHPSNIASKTQVALQIPHIKSQNFDVLYEILTVVRYFHSVFDLFEIKRRIKLFRSDLFAYSSNNDFRKTKLIKHILFIFFVGYWHWQSIFSP
ncbi:hypothetical protein HanRHA438_Chr01g0006981 [Helianthus annuus]|nr:hypothetical protein HanRHA438_Chr01g0006981 [Helianthus annuus]